MNFKMSSSDEIPSEIENETHNIIKELMPCASKNKYEEALIVLKNGVTKRTLNALLAK